jgi:hypothetical protein
MDIARIKLQYINTNHRLNCAKRNTSKNENHCQANQDKPWNLKKKQAQALGAQQCSPKNTARLQQTNNTTTTPSFVNSKYPQLNPFTLCIYIPHILNRNKRLHDLNKIITAIPTSNFPPHKAHNLLGNGRGGRKCLKQNKNKQHLCHLAQHSIDKNNVAANTIYSNILCTCSMKFL